MLRFIHTADLHLDTPFKGLTNWNADLASRLKDAAFKAFRQIIDLCIQEKVDFLLIGGDVFDSENKSLGAQLKFVNALKILAEANIPVYFVCGNHDPLNSWLPHLSFPDNVYQFTNYEEVQYTTFYKEGRPVADIYGISFKDKVVTQNLAVKFRKKQNPAPWSIALLHGTVGTPGSHENYAPFKQEDVLHEGFDYWALGHIHKAQVLHDEVPGIAYPGIPQGRDFGESGQGGCFLVELEEAHTLNITFKPLSGIRFETFSVDVSGEDKLQGLSERIHYAVRQIEQTADDCSFILRVRLTGRTRLHKQLNKPGETESFIQYFNEEQLHRNTFCRIDKMIVNTQPDNIDLEQIKQSHSFPAALLKAFDAYYDEPERLMALISQFEDEFSQPKIKRELSGLSQEELYEVLEKARWMVLDRILDNDKNN